jgi:hypothetical protein
MVWLGQVGLIRLNNKNAKHDKEAR